MNISRFLQHFEAVRRSGAGWSARCPAHDDHDPSLSLGEGDDGRLLVHCQAGCDTGAVLAAANLAMTDLFPDAITRVAPAEVVTYDYVDENGQLLSQVVRRSPKGFVQRRPAGDGGWTHNVEGVRRVLYRLPDLLKAVRHQETIYLVEGEKDVDRLVTLGVTATTNPGGAGKWRQEFSECLIGVDVVILPDADDPGHAHAEQVAVSLHGRAASVKIVALPGLPTKGDVSDWLNAGGTRQELERLAAEQPVWTPSEIRLQTLTGGKATQAQDAVALAADAELFHTAEDETYGTFPVKDHRETWPIRSSGFKRWLAREFYTATGKPLGRQPLQEALELLDARAHYEGPEQPVFVRIARHRDALYLDLVNEAWEVVEVTAQGWRIRSESPVRFQRVRGSQPLPHPQRGGSLDDLRPFVNIQDEQAWTLFVGFLLDCFRPGDAPHPILIFEGPQGAAKSTTSRVPRLLVDPAWPDLRFPPSSERDLVIAARNSWLQAFDNLGTLPPWLSDALCRLSTGGGFATRALYTDAEEMLFSATRPIILNGIAHVATQHDLLDRAVILNLAAVDEQDRQDEMSFWANFNQVRPRVLGALLDAVVVALVNVATVRLDRSPRMADFARWVTAGEPGLGWEPGRFLQAYRDNRVGAVSDALAFEPLAEAVQTLTTQQPWEGSASELLAKLEKQVPESVRNSRTWPASASALSARLKSLSASLRQVGVEVQYLPRTANRRLIRITNLPEPSSQVSRASQQTWAVREVVVPSSVPSMTHIVTRHDGELGVDEASSRATALPVMIMTARDDNDDKIDSGDESPEWEEEIL